MFVKRFTLTLLFALSFLPATSLQANNNSIEQSVVLLTNYQQVPDWQSPWKMTFTSSGTGTGFLIHNDWILTNAHVVSNSRLLLVNKLSSPEPFIADVIAIAHDSDLAILRVRDTTFYEGLVPLTLGKMPVLQSRVRTYGYPVGGRTISRTEGVVSRVEFGTYVHSGVDSHLIIQTDSAINPGNSGGPVVQDGAVVGVAFQSNPGLNDVGYLIPVQLVQRFLNDIEDGTYNGVPEIGIQTSALLNRHHRQFLKMPSDVGGVLVDHVVRRTAAEGKLFPGDVLIEVEGVPVDQAGNVEYEGHRVGFHILAENKQVDETMTFKVWRNEQFEYVTILLAPPPYSEEIRLSYDVLPQYVIVGGLVFAPLNRNYLQSTQNTPALLYEHLFREVEMPGSRRDQTVVLIRVLPAPVNTGYANLRNFIVDKVNGVKIQSLEHLKSVIKETPAEANYFVFESEWNPTLVVLKRSDVLQQHDLILQRYGIPQGERL